MFKTKSKIHNLLAFLFVFAFVFSAAAQQQQMPEREVRTDFSDEELEMFAEAAQEVQVIQQQNQQNMVEAIEGEGLTVEEFNQMFEAMQNPEAEMEATAEEEEAFDNAMQAINRVQEEGDREVQEAIEGAGLSYQEYEEIMMAYQQDPEIQQRVNELMR